MSLRQTDLHHKRKGSTCDMKSYAHGALAGDDLQKRKGFERQEIGQRR